MKNKILSISLALAMTVSTATLLVACGDDKHTHTGGTATCTEKAVCSICGEIYGEALGHTYASEWLSDDTHHWHAATCDHTTEVSAKAEHNWDVGGKCIDCKKEKPTDATITQEEWRIFFDSLTALSLEAEMSAPAMNVSHSIKQHNGVTYWKQTYDGDSETVYSHYDDDTYTVEIYWINPNVVTWQKRTQVFNNAEEYADYKAKNAGLARSSFGMDFTSEQSGAGGGLGELYPAFTYDSDSDVYTANLYMVSTSSNGVTSEKEYRYYEVVWKFKFENGKIVSGSLTQMIGEQSATMDFTINYDLTELVIPSEILNISKN